MLQVPGLRVSYDKVGRLVYFGRTLGKNRLHAISKLPAEYQTNLGDAPAEVERWAVLPVSRNQIPGACGAHP
jgi:hypothetical protein